MNRLHKQLLEFYPNANYYCYTEDSTNITTNIIPIFKSPSLRKWWNKLSLFRSDMPLQGKCLYFDLDMDIMVNMDYINGKHMPVDIYYKGFWNVIFFKPERVEFILRNRLFQVI